MESRELQTPIQLWNYVLPTNSDYTVIFNFEVHKVDREKTEILEGCGKVN